MTDPIYGDDETAWHRLEQGLKWLHGPSARRLS